MVEASRVIPWCSGTAPGYIVGSSEKPWHVTFTLQKERGKWRVINTEGIVPEEIFL